MIKKILVINPFGIGDVIFSTPLVDVLKKEFPDAHIAYICNERVSELMAADPRLSRIFVYEKDEYRSLWNHSKIACINKIIGFLKDIKKEKFDISIDLSLGYQYSMYLKLAGIRKRLGFNYRNRGKFLTDKVDMRDFDDKHVIEHYLDILRLLNINMKDHSVRPHVYTTNAGIENADRVLKKGGISRGDLLVGLVPGCGASWGKDAIYRRWDKKNFAIVADMLMEKYGAKIILLGDAKEADICDDIESMVKGRLVNRCGKTTIGDFLGLMSRCALIITNDGGPLHMAVGLGVKTVSIFGPVDEKVYGPYPPGDDHIVVSKKYMPCRPCYKKFKYNKCENRACLNSITAEDVMKAVEGILGR